MKTVLGFSDSSKKVALGTIGIVGFSTIHHIYGGWLYDTSWRILMPIIFFAPMLMLTLYFQYLSIKKKNSVAFTINVIFIILWIVVLGFGEGGYNHVMKNILYFSGASDSLMNKMFPPEFGTTSLFEKPDNWFFEITGILTTGFGFYLSYYLNAFIKDVRLKNK